MFSLPVKFAKPLATLWLLGAVGLACAADTADLLAGRRMFEQGVLPNGDALAGVRLDNVMVRGRLAACANCHQASGMGTVEGDIQVPPISGRYLFPTIGDRPQATMDPRIGKRLNLKREPYPDDAKLAVAIRTGHAMGGKQMSEVMPRYSLNDADMGVLTGYLRSLSVQASPGVLEQERIIRFATVITPGIEPERKKILLDMLKTAFMQKNASTVTGNASRRHMVTAAEFVLGTENKWALDVWELTGAPETWGAQLEGYNRLAPPFALVSGLSNTTWAPVQEFCESQRVPCWFPSVKLPPPQEKAARYSFYFSRGLGLEADVLAQQFKPASAPSEQRNLIQIFRSSNASAGAVAQVARHAGAALAIENIDLDTLATSDVPTVIAKRMAATRSQDAVMLWLAPTDLVIVAPALTGKPINLMASGAMVSGDATSIPGALRASVRLVYPYALPETRAANVGYLHTWLKLRRLPLVDEPLQSEIYFAVNFLTDTMSEMLDNLYRDYLVERAENMIGQRETRKAEDEMRDQAMVRPRVRAVAMDPRIPRPTLAHGNAEHMSGVREGTTVYPRLSLGPGQRYASKGAYWVRFADPENSRLITDSPWILP